MLQNLNSMKNKYSGFKLLHVKIFQITEVLNIYILKYFNLLISRLISSIVKNLYYSIYIKTTLFICIICSQTYMHTHSYIYTVTIFKYIFFSCKRKLL